MINITIKELQLAARLLKLAAGEFGNHGCNDISKETWGDFTKEERITLIRQFHIDNEEDEEAAEGHSEIPDWLLMDILADKLNNA